MPIYEYECNRCRKRFEVIQGFSDPPIKTCDYCSGEVTKVISPPAIVFKGSGWYVTDYSDKFKDKDKAADKIKKPVTETKEKSVDTKPAGSSSQPS